MFVFTQGLLECLLGFWPRPGGGGGRGEGARIKTKNLAAKLKDSDQNSLLSRVKFYQAWNNPAQELRFWAWLNLYVAL